MIYETHQPSSDLAPFVDCYWRLSAPARLIHEPERILPDGSFELIFNFADPFEEVASAGSRHIQPMVLLVGQLTRFMLAQPTGRIDLLAVRFRPAGAAAFFEPPLGDFTDVSTSGCEVDRCWARAWEALGNAESGDRVVLLEEFLRSRVRPSGVIATVSALAWEVQRADGLVSVSHLSSLAGLSPRALQRAFKRQVGISAKLLTRIVRVQSALRLHARMPSLSMSAIAHWCGYYDHAHFTRDFTSITGQSPREFLGSPHELSDLLTEVP